MTWLIEDMERLVFEAFSRKPRRALVMVEFELPMTLAIELIPAGTENDHGNESVYDKILLQTEEGKASVYRHTAQNPEGIMLSTAGGYKTLCLSFKEYDNAHLDRGICWVNSGFPAKGTIAFKAETYHDLTDGAVMDFVLRARQYAIETIEMALAGKISKIVR